MTHHNRFIFPDISYFSVRDVEISKKLIDEICDKDICMFVADWSNDAYDAVLINVPQLGVRYFNNFP